MKNDIFMAGVQPGGPTSHDEIKMLICYMLSHLEGPLSFSLLHEALAANNLVNYFELVQAVEGLRQTEHLETESREDGEWYTVTAVGRQAGHEFESALPLSVREKALQTADRLVRARRREAEVTINVREADSGFYMDLAIPQEEDALISFSLFLPTQKECDRVRRRFLNDPVFIYKGVLALLTGDQEVLGRLFPAKNDLFA